MSILNKSSSDRLCYMAAITSRFWIAAVLSQLITVQDISSVMKNKTRDFHRPHLPVVKNLGRRKNSA